MWVGDDHFDFLRNWANIRDPKGRTIVLLESAALLTCFVGGC